MCGFAFYAFPACKAHGESLKVGRVKADSHAHLRDTFLPSGFGVRDEDPSDPSFDAVIDHRDLLRRYIHLVMEMEGIPFFGHARTGYFTDEELAELNQLADEE